MSDLSAFPPSLLRDNRAQGLLRELIEVIDGEDSSLALWRLERALLSASRYARSRSWEVEKTSKEIERARNYRGPRRNRPRLAGSFA